MKIKFIVICLTGISIVLFSLIRCESLTAKIDTLDNTTDKYIKIIKLNSRTILIKLGSDAVTAIATQKGIVVIDAGISNSLTAKYRNIIEKEFNRNDFAYLINTHSHSDHTGGNQVFADVKIIGHENCSAEITNEWKNKEKIKLRLLKIVNDYTKELDTLNKISNEWEEIYCQKIRYQYSYNDLLNDHIITVPSVTFNDSLKIAMGDVTFNLIYFGKAHSASDIIIHIPALKMLFTGDLFSKYGRPSMTDDQTKDVETWKKSLRWLSLRQNEIDVIVGGHGQILTKDDLISFNKSVKEQME